MWQQRDPTMRITSKNNLILRNLRKDLTTQELSALFSGYGNLISCKISKNAKGNSEGFGFVQFSKEEDANQSLNDFKENPAKFEELGLSGDKSVLIDFFEKNDLRNKSDS